MPSDEVWTQQTTINLGVFFFRFDHLPTYYREDIGSKIQDIHHVFRECIDQRPQAGHEPSWSEVHSLCCELQKLINDAENYTPPRGKNVEKYIRINATGESITIGFGDGEALELDFSTPPPFSSIEHLRDATVPPTEEEVHLFGMLFLSIADLEECLAFYGTFEFPTRSVSVHLLAAARAVQRALDDIVHYTRDPVQGIDDPTILVYPVQGNIRITYGEDEAFHLQWPKGQGLPPHLLRMVPRHTVDDALLASDGQKDCSICLEQMENGQRILKLLCGHYYHDACVSEWFENKRTCPICRYDVMTTSYEHDAHHHAHDHAHHHDHHHDGH
ncbi:hypothetical protein N7468_004321 [Penicillium chermesinum]|uniref:RING-type domain-containing protein n=1 Tax=Penicillium chermesinum TaxID=63820 RepID=A0A9W9P8D1_9EURO|nr:uncharacterized protein N7468_004321 [Penicillium chermesinum]KAJ5239702.1 hypothetical protein N7468_004321 [Penicillium chermesinum]KAJ6166586.1 hypothetical protein N7470_002033 [Penicillium chermesinum]